MHTPTLPHPSFRTSAWNRRRLRLAPVVAVVLSVVGWTAPASAQTEPATAPAAGNPSFGLFVVAKKDTDAEAAGLLQKVLRQQVAELGGVTLHAYNGSLSAPTELLAAIEEGYRALNDAVTVKQDTKKLGTSALQAFERAQQQVTALGATGGALPRRAVARLYKGIAVAHALNQDGPTAQRYIEDSLNLWPSQTPREYGWSADAASLLSFVAKRRSDNTDTGKLAVNGVAGAAVWVDGKARGEVPLVIERLRPGKHHVVVRADGYRVMNQIADVTKDETVTVDAALKPLPTKDAAMKLVGEVTKARSASKTAPLLSELVTKLGADGVVVVQVATKKGKWNLSAWSAKPGQPPGQIKAVVARDAAMMGLLQKLAVDTTGGTPGKAAPESSTSLGDPPRNSLLVAKVPEPKVAAGDKAAVGAEGVDETEFYETWWFWTAVGGGVVIITTAAILAAVLSEDEDPKFGKINIKLNPL